MNAVPKEKPRGPRKRLGKRRRAEAIGFQTQKEETNVGIIDALMMKLHSWVLGEGLVWIVLTIVVLWLIAVMIDKVQGN